MSLKPIKLRHRKIEADGKVREWTTYRARWVDADGKIKSATFDTDAAARAFARRQEVERDEIKAGLRAAPEAVAPTLREAAAEWLTRRTPKQRVKANSHLRVHILPRLGDLHLDEIQPAHLEELARALESRTVARAQKPGASAEVDYRGRPRRFMRPGSVKQTLAVVEKLLADFGYNVRIKYAVPTEGYAWIRDPRDVGRFLEACDGWFKIAAALAVYAGLRAGEIAGLRQDRINFDLGFLVVDHSYDSCTKGKKVRHVRLCPELASLLREWIFAHPGRLVIEKSTHKRDGSIVTRMIDKSVDKLAERTRRACRAAGVEPVHFHALRHTYASHLAQRVALPVVGAMLGHSNPTTTARYCHLETESLARDPRLDLAFSLGKSADVIQFQRPS